MPTLFFIMTLSWVGRQNQRQNEEKATLQWETALGRRQWSHSSCSKFYHLALTRTFWIKMLSFRYFAARDPVRIWMCHSQGLFFSPHFIWFVCFLLWFQAFFIFHRVMKIWTIMTKTRKEGIRCINRKISLLSSHFLLFIFLPAAVFTCRSQTRSLGQSPAK